MLLLALILLPLLAALVSALTPSGRVRPLIVVGTGVLHLAGTLAVRSGDAALGGWFAADPLGRLILLVVSVLFTLCAVYGVGYLRLRSERPNLVFCVCLLTFLSMTTAITIAQHLALVWVAVEGATLSTAILIYFNHNARSLEAAWKYLMIGSVGIALALLGSLFVAYAALHGASGDESLLFSALLEHGAGLSRPWLRAGFVLLVVGYGTKMGLAPMHTWKPDAYGEAPGIIGALLAGGMTNCAFLALLRVYRVMQAAGEGAFARELFLGFGLVSMAVAAAFMAGQRDFKRMLAYSSVEHMGILVLGIGVGGLAVVGALLHVVNNALTKVVLFLSAGNIHRAYGSKSIDKVSGALRRVPVSGALFLAGFLAITGSPPFGPFISEFTILSGAMSGRHYVVAAFFLTFLVVIFIGMGATVLAVVQGPVSPAGATTDFRDTFWRVAPMLAALTMVVVMGVWIPDGVYDLVLAAAKMLEGGVVSAGVVVRNGRAVALKDVPSLETSHFRGWLVNGVRDKGRRLVSYFGMAADPGGSAPDGLSLVAVLADDANGRLSAARTICDGTAFASLVPEVAQAHLFEREIAEQYGVRFEGHPWMKPVRYHRSYRPGHDAWGRPSDAAILPGVTDFFRVEGAEVHEVAVGPVHAGVIEPGHFRFQCHGEQVFHLEIALGYQHRGVERALGGGPTKRTLPYMETVAGDTTIGHTLAYAHAIEALAGARISARAHAIRGIALELERLANHVGDLGALAGDVAYLPTASYCGRLRGDFLNMTAEICGSRFGRGLVRPGGVGFDLLPAQVTDVRARIVAARRDVTEAVELLWETPSVRERFEGTGKVRPEDAMSVGLVGPAARACGIQQDVRHDFPAGIYRFVHLPVMTAHHGDVNSRAYVRWLEIQQSIAFILRQLDRLPAGEPRVAPGPLRPEAFVVSLTEGWRGEIAHVATTDAAGRFSRYKITDPSFHNWFGLALALRNGQISDFPLCNKSFNLSYCGHDL